MKSPNYPESDHSTIKNSAAYLAVLAVIAFIAGTNISKHPASLQTAEEILDPVIATFHKRCIDAVLNHGYPEAGDFSDLLQKRNEILESHGFSADSVTFWCREPTHRTPQVCLRLAGTKEQKCF